MNRFVLHWYNSHGYHIEVFDTYQNLINYSNQLLNNPDNFAITIQIYQKERIND